MPKKKAKTYYCGLCDEEMKTDLSESEDELKAHYKEKHKQFVTKENAEKKQVTIEIEPGGMTMYVKEG